MKPIEECFDIVLRQLKYNWSLRDNQRPPLNGELLLQQFGLPSEDQKHEFFKGLMRRLHKDGYIEYKYNQIHSEPSMDFYQEDTLISLEGYYFIENGGYTQRKINDAAEDTRLKNIETSQLALSTGLNVVTGWIAAGTIALVVIGFLGLALQYHWFSCGK